MIDTLGKRFFKAFAQKGIKLFR